jgi:hypothetical protein
LYKQLEKSSSVDNAAAATGFAAASNDSTASCATAEGSERISSMLSPQHDRIVGSILMRCRHVARQFQAERSEHQADASFFLFLHRSAIDTSINKPASFLLRPLDLLHLFKCSAFVQM